jgi:hypothetical protein
MAVKAGHQRLPSAGPKREALRKKGQFWTPAWIAEAMVAYVLQGDADHVFDPAVGAGAFFHAAKVVGAQLGRPITLHGAEIDGEAIEQARKTGLSTEDLAFVQMQDFVLHPPTRQYEAIVANPPYIRHHRLPQVVKAQLQKYGRDVMGKALDGRAGLHVYFLLRALQMLPYDGRLAFIMPADTCEGKFATPLWNWITSHYKLEAVVTFAADATPFPGIDTNPIVFMIRHCAPESTFLWAQCTETRTPNYKAWTISGFRDVPTSGLVVYERYLQEALNTGLSRQITVETNYSEAKLGDFVTVMRGIATGANDFFFLTKEQARQTRIPETFFRIAVGRTRDIPAAEITDQVLAQLDRSGRPTQLLYLDNRPVDAFPVAIREYIRQGEQRGLPKKSLISQRKPWYKMEIRAVPPFLFAYLGRNNVRFIRNTARVLPLTSFLCVYPRNEDPAYLEKIWKLLQQPEIIANLYRVGKSYGANAIKVEPRALERLPIPASALHAAGLDAPEQTKQLVLL